MAPGEPTFTLGIEEEYLLVDKSTRDLIGDPPQELLSDCEAALAEAGGQVSPEFMRSQIEVGTRVCHTIKEAREDLARLRGIIARCSNHYGLAPIAASTHPFAEWHAQQHTNKERYNVLAADLQIIARRMLISGMHVHIGIDDDDLRVDIMNQAKYFLPHLLALSTSSPFWRGQYTGLRSYRLSIFDELPRTGLPEVFSSHAEYERTVEVLIHAKLIEDSSKIWWDLRPSARFPTLEMRITDICSRLDDAIAIAALFLCLFCRMLYRLRRLNQRWRSYSPFLIMENRWRAQRYGTAEGLVDFGKSELVPFADLLEEMIHLTREDAEALDCVAEVEACRDILQHGTSAERQIAVYEAAIRAGAEPREALRSVVDALITDMVRGTAADQHVQPQDPPPAICGEPANGHAAQQLPMNGRILIVEDETLVALEFEQWLRQEGCTVVGPAPNVALALSLLKQEAPDAALLDLNLNGELSDVVAETLVDKGIPFVIISGHAKGQVSERVLKQAPHLDKPVNRQQLLGVLANAISSSH